MGAERARAARGGNRRRLKYVLILTSAYMAAEVVGGLLTGSLALLADAGHMLTDVGGIALALFTMHLAERAATSERTYGYYRAEILASLTNSVVLIGISLFVVYEAWQRLLSPPAIASGEMLGVAAVGLVVNLIGLFLLRRSASGSLNMKGAYFEVLSDLLSSVAVIVAAIVMWTTGWYYADPLLSAGIGLVILPRTWVLLKEAVGVLLEGTPSDVNVPALRAALLAVEGVEDVHDLHVWSLTSGVNALSVHLVNGRAPSALILQRARAVVSSQFNIQHVTVQVEPVRCAESEHA